MDEYPRGYERERGAHSYRTQASFFGCLLGLAFVAVVFVALTLLSAFLHFPTLPAGN